MQQLSYAGSDEVQRAVEDERLKHLQNANSKGKKASCEPHTFHCLGSTAAGAPEPVAGSKFHIPGIGNAERM